MTTAAGAAQPEVDIETTGRRMMSHIDVLQFIGAIQGWARQRDGQFKYNWPVKGGWEGWIQVDLTASILTAAPTAEILREQPVYTNTRQRCDLLLNTTAAPDAQVIVELKAESWHNRAAFVPGVIDDLDKLQQSVSPAYAGSNRVMLAMPFSQPSYQDVLGIQIDGHRIFSAVHVGEVACLVAVRTAQGWLSPEGLGVPEVAGALPFVPAQPATAGR
ncbi:hypothetical protein AB0I91_33815 [Actinosynnema sp. NPDC049800]